MSSTEETIKVLVYSDDADVRGQVRLAIGRRPAADLPLVEIVECATDPMVVHRLADEHFAAVILDGEAQPAGGLGICRQIKDEVYHCPPVLVIVGRRDDGWLATWSRADAVVSHPIDPVAFAEALAGLLRAHAQRSIVS